MGDESWTFSQTDRKSDPIKILQENPISAIYDKYLAKSRNFAYSPTGDQLAVVKDGRVEVWQLGTSPTKPIFSDSQYQYTSVAFSLDGTKLATGSEEGWIQLWDIPLTVDGQVEPGQIPSLLNTFQTHQQAVNTLAFRPDDPNLLMTGGADGNVKFWDLSQSTPDSSRLTLRNVKTIALSQAKPVPVMLDRSLGLVNSKKE